ncbi:MAG: arginine--tRNA ligase [Anaerolineaceae bacterium]|nr:arginine--tRNA ligase [Anaerolineaceae bacterium]
MFEKEQKESQSQIEKILKEKRIPIQPFKWSTIPFSGHWGISTSFFATASFESRSKKGINVRKRASEIADIIAAEIQLPKAFVRAEAVKGYLNLYYDSMVFAQRAVDNILSEGKNFGSAALTGKKVMVEYSQPNTHKAFHVGHLRNMVLGSSICEILEFSGKDVVRANYIGDIGLHVIKWLWNYINFHNGEEPPKEGKTRWMGGLYAEAIKRIEERPEYKEQVRELFKKWDEKDPKLIELWKRTRQWSLDAFDEVYKLLGIKFDKVYFESEVEKPGKKIVERLIDEGLAKDERPEGAVIIDLDEILGTDDKYKVLVILRSDGTSLYPTKDIPLAIKKFSDFDLERSIYVIDVRQSLYLKQIFMILKLMGYDWAKDCYHLAYEIVNLPGNVTIASREGTVVLLEDLTCEAEKRAYKIVDEKNSELSADTKKDIAIKVAIGAIKYSLLSRDNTKIITFDWEAAMDVNGQAAPYIQYAGVRANSILRKVQFKLPESDVLHHKLNKDEIELIDLLARFSHVVQRAARDLRPLLIANYSYEVARAFSNFYNKCPVLKANVDVRNFRLRLVAAAKQVITNSLNLLGIEVPEVM